ncbi:putative methylase [Cystobasidium minutum MCA 4210]|uniref:putative methylase n=1 Tax=Cystobasidium minutum MCA 4210 TaxID=1397322 RepID=UPI0034CE66A7|eukprot:jgi/Rhomi1/192449/gm1.663_g
MIPTPDLSHLKKADYDHIYEPAEDTFILLDALEQDQEAIRKSKPRICLEIGSGTGCVSAFLAEVIGKKHAAFFSTDINPRAVEATVRTGKQNGVDLNSVLGSLHGPFASRLAHKVDVLVFNPPYVPTDEEEGEAGQSTAGISAAWAGGSIGMTTTEAVIHAAPALLSDTGVFYLVAIQQNKPLEIIEQAKALGLAGEVALKRRAGGEILYVLRFRRNATHEI